jgi:hypothetical protein
MNIAVHLGSVLFPALGIIASTGCGEGGNAQLATPPPIGAVKSFAWDPSQDPTVTAHHLHYGEQSPGQKGSCDYEHSQSTPSSSVTITGLDPNTRYYAAVSSFNGQESPCSKEVSFLTASSEQGADQKVPEMYSGLEKDALS